MKSCTISLYTSIDILLEVDFMCNDNIANKLIDMITRDIETINNSLCLPLAEQITLHKELDERYNGIIPNWGKGLFNRNSQTGFDYNSISCPLISSNLVSMRSALLAYRSELTGINAAVIPSQIFCNYMTKVNIAGSNFSFSQARKVISTLTNVTEDEITTALDAVNTIELVLCKNIPSYQKWEKLVDVVTWVAAQPFNIAMCILPLLLKIQ